MESYKALNCLIDVLFADGGVDHYKDAIREISDWKKRFRISALVMSTIIDEVLANKSCSWNLYHLEGLPMDLKKDLIKRFL